MSSSNKAWMAVAASFAMGKSRAPTLIIAYLLAHPLSASSSATQEPPTPETLLALLRQVRSFAEPNPGFMAQLNLYHRMGCPSTVDNHPLYQRWCYERRVQYSIALGQAPGIEDIAFGDEAAGEVTDSGKRAENSKAFRCRRCRTQLGTDACLVEHFPASSASPRNARNGRSGEAVETGRNTQPCAHIFLDPLSWMRAELSEGRLEGRLECPNGKCRQNVGKYAWQGMKCSCGQWVVPGISLAKGKVDEVARKAGGDGR
ncbi:MAG: hypothetical protein LQ351_006478 [Letrouitia transgressa]|nr:MAG: hypothetical protein LQ351_006478 [Letrouitia transgressa]